MQHARPDDYVVATGETRSVRELVEAAFAAVDLPWEKFVKHDDSFKRPIEPRQLVGNSEKIRRTLGGKPTASFVDLIREMVKSEVRALNRVMHNGRFLVCFTDAPTSGPKLIRGDAGFSDRFRSHMRLRRGLALSMWGKPSGFQETLIPFT